MSLNVNTVQKQDPEILQHDPQNQQQHITIHQLPISNAVVSYTQMANPISTSTLHIPPTIVGNSSASVHPSPNVNLGSSIQTNRVTMNSPPIGLAVLSNSNQVTLKAEYTEPKTEYS